jgi:parallel beta-helix repeat protein
MDNNEFNFYVSGATTAACNNEIDESNTINGAPIVYWVGKHDKTVPQNAAYVGLVSCTNITVQNLNLAHNGQSLLLADVSNSKITDNTLTDNRNGIWLIESTNNQIEKNTLTSNVFEAIYMSGSYNNRIVQNCFADNGLAGMPMAEETGIRGRSGLRLYNSSNNEITNNRFTGNGEGINLHESDNNTISANTLENTFGSAINLFMSESNLFRYNTLKGNDCAMRIWSSPKNTVEYNQISNNSLGILLDHSAENIIVYNNITDNRGFGMQLKSPSALLGGSQNNTIHHNNFINNQAEGLDVSIPAIMGDPHIGDPREAITIEWLPGLGNVWDDGKEGNYWSDYTTRYPDAQEAGNSGTGNTAFVINENNQDNHPLMAPVAIAFDAATAETQIENNSPIPLPFVALAIVICIAAIAAVLVYAKGRGAKAKSSTVQKL